MARPESELIAWLGQAGDTGTLGGKAASLDRLASFGFRIPPGFCLTTAAFRAQLATIARGDGIAERVAETPLEPALAAALRTATDALVDEVATAAAAATLGSPFGPRFAVRSSAIGEDGAEASYAGLHETELDVPPDGIEAAVRRCWASLWSAPAVAYRARRGLEERDPSMAVVVQALVPADAAAVAFTRHPVTGRPDQVVVTAVRGLGDAMVSGTVTPDTFVIAKDDRRVIEFEPGDGPERSLDAATLDALTELVLSVERAYGAAVDVEAAVAGGTWYLLQARPITTGVPASAA